MRIAILEDDLTQSEMLRWVLESVNHKCHCFATFKSFQTALYRDSFDLVLLDWVLPDSSGPKVMHWILFEITDLEFHPKFSTIVRHTKRVVMTQKEFDLALLLFRNLGKPLSRSHIQETVWGRDTDLPSRTMDTHISRVRSKLALRPEQGFRLTPVYGFGYKLEQRLAFPAEQLQEALRALTQRVQAPEAAILSTCNRTEVYCAASNIEQLKTDLLEWLA
eukprot:gene12013-11807_t